MVCVRTHLPSTVPVKTAFGPFRVLHCDESIAVGEVGPVCVAIWRGAVTKAPFEWQRAGLAETVQRYPREAGFLCVVEIHAEPPGQELRNASSQMIVSHGEGLACVATVVEGDGFMAAIARGTVGGMILLARKRKCPVRVFATVREAAAWMGQHVHIPSIPEFATNVETIRSRLPPPAKKR
jgi:hypothetical protein